MLCVLLLNFAFWVVSCGSWFVWDFDCFVLLLFRWLLCLFDLLLDFDNCLIALCWKFVFYMGCLLVICCLLCLCYI